MGLNKELRRMDKKFEEDIRKMGEDFRNNMLDQWEESQQIVKNSLDRHDRIQEKKEIALEKLYRIREKYIAKNIKKNLFEALDIAILLHKNTEVESICRMLKLFEPDDKESIRLVLMGFKDSQKEIDYFHRDLTIQEKFRTYWWEVFYLVKRGLIMKLPYLEYVVRVICKEFGTEDPELNDNDTMEIWLKEVYPKFQPERVYWGYDFSDDYNEERIEERISEIQNFFLFDPEDNNEFHRALNRNFLLGINDSILYNGAEIFSNRKDDLDEGVENETQESENLVNASDDTIKQQPQKDKTEDKLTKEKKEKKSIFPTTSPLQKFSEKLRGKTNSMSDSMSNSFESLTKKISETTEDLANATSVEEVKKKMKKGLKGWLNKLSDKLDD